MTRNQNVVLCPPCGKERAVGPDGRVVWHGGKKWATDRFWGRSRVRCEGSLRFPGTFPAKQEAVRQVCEPFFVTEIQDQTDQGFLTRFRSTCTASDDCRWRSRATRTKDFASHAWKIHANVRHPGIRRGRLMPRGAGVATGGGAL